MIVIVEIGQKHKKRLMFIIRNLLERNLNYLELKIYIERQLFWFFHNHFLLMLCNITITDLCLNFEYHLRCEICFKYASI